MSIIFLKYLDIHVAGDNDSSNDDSNHDSQTAFFEIVNNQKEDNVAENNDGCHGKNHMRIIEPVRKHSYRLLRFVTQVVAR